MSATIHFRLGAAPAALDLYRAAFDLAAQEAPMATCYACKGSGNTAARALLEYLAIHILDIGQEADRACWGRVRPTEHLRRQMAYPPAGDVGPDGLALAVGLSGKEPLGMIGYGVESAYAASVKIIAAAGLDPATWGVCPACGGTGEEEAPI